MSNLPSNDIYGSNAQMVDRRIGDAFPIVEAVYAMLDRIKYLSETLPDFSPKEIEFRGNDDLREIQWRYAGVMDNSDASYPWETLVTYNSIVGTDINALILQLQTIYADVQNVVSDVNAAALAAANSASQAASTALTVQTAVGSAEDAAEAATAAATSATDAKSAAALSATAANTAKAGAQTAVSQAQASAAAAAASAAEASAVVDRYPNYVPDGKMLSGLATNWSVISTSGGNISFNSMVTNDPSGSLYGNGYYRIDFSSSDSGSVELQIGGNTFAIPRQSAISLLLDYRVMSNSGTASDFNIAVVFQDDTGERTLSTDRVVILPQVLTGWTQERIFFQPPFWATKMRVRVTIYSDLAQQIRIGGLTVEPDYANRSDNAVLRTSSGIAPLLAYSSANELTMGVFTVMVGGREFTRTAVTTITVPVSSRTNGHHTVAINQGGSLVFDPTNGYAVPIGTFDYSYGGIVRASVKDCGNLGALPRDAWSLLHTRSGSDMFQSLSSSELNHPNANLMRLGPPPAGEYIITLRLSTLDELYHIHVRVPNMQANYTEDSLFGGTLTLDPNNIVGANIIWNPDEYASGNTDWHIITRKMGSISATLYFVAVQFKPD